jgi:hypothetical protein
MSLAEFTREPSILTPTNSWELGGGRLLERDHSRQVNDRELSHERELAEVLIGFKNVC